MSTNLIASKMDTFFKRHKMPIFTEGETYNLNRTIKIESTISNLPTKKLPDPDDFTGESYQIYEEKIIPIL